MKHEIKREHTNNETENEGVVFYVCGLWEKMLEPCRPGQPSDKS